MAGDRIKREVKKAFENNEVRQAFVNDLINNLDHYPTNFKSTAKAVAAFTKIAEHFGLTKKMVQKMIIDGGEKISGITIKYLAEDGKYYFINANQDEITLGQEPKALKRKQ